MAKSTKLERGLATVWRAACPGPMHSARNLVAVGVCRRLRAQLDHRRNCYYNLIEVCYRLVEEEVHQRGGE
jgi:hypothetical protein